MATFLRFIGAAWLLFSLFGAAVAVTSFAAWSELGAAAYLGPVGAAVSLFYGAAGAAICFGMARLLDLTEQTEAGVHVLRRRS